MFVFFSVRHNNGRLPDAVIINSNNSDARKYFCATENCLEFFFVLCVNVHCSLYAVCEFYAYDYTLYCMILHSCVECTKLFEFISDNGQLAYTK